VAILPEPPNVILDVVADRSDEREGFLSLKRYELVVVDGASRSRPLRYDMIERRAIDAAIMIAHYLDASGEPYVYLRSAIRPPLALRPGSHSHSQGATSAVLWEVPAGLIEPGEAPRDAAARELEEELGFTMRAEQMQPLGPNAYPAPAMIGEVHFFFHVRVDPATRKEPGGDGSLLEEAARIVELPLERAVAACRAGEIADAKSELALRRLAEIL
jgi:ADP-ribose pyrophosphatase